MKRGATRGKRVGPGQSPGRSHEPPLKLRRALSPEQDIDEDRKILISMDYGTKTLSVAWRVATLDDNPQASNILGVPFSSDKVSAPQKVAWTQDGSFLWGIEVEKELRSKTSRITEDDIVELWKLKLYEDHATSDISKHVDAQLGSRTLDDLLSTHLRAVIERVKEVIGRSLELSTTKIDNIPIQLFLSVPQMWQAPANRRMIEAAATAGIPYVELVYEPQCAAAYYAFHAEYPFFSKSNVGKNILIADIGGGTGDFVLYKITDVGEDVADIRLELEGKATGALCGSVFVNQNFVNWMKKQVNFDAKCHSMGTSTLTCTAKAAEQFEAIKQQFSDPDTRDQYISVRGSTRETLELTLTSEDICSFFDPVIEQIARCINELKTPKTKELILPGGFGRSSYLCQQLEGKCALSIMPQQTPTTGAFEPVSRGALIRYHSIETRGLESDQSFGIARVEVWNPDDHPDASYEEGDRMGNGKICGPKPCKNPHLVGTDPFDGTTDIVWERWSPLVETGKQMQAGTVFTSETWQTYMPAVGDETIEVQIYWTKKTVHPHEPTRVGRDSSSKLKEGIYKWGDELKMPLPNLRELGFEASRANDGALRYDIYCRLVLQCRGANIKVRWQIALPGTSPYDGNAHTDAECRVYEYVICNSAYNPNPRV